METNVKAIETVYHGYRFRSRLEARWAVYFDTCGWDWEYEPEGYDLNGTYYLPDFMLHNVWDFSAQLDKGQNQYVGDLAIEVKGVMTEEDYEKVRLYQKYVGPILVLGNIPAGDCLAEIMRDVEKMASDRTQPCGKTCFYAYRAQLHDCTKCSLWCLEEGFKETIRIDKEEYHNETISHNICPRPLNTVHRALIASSLSDIPALISPDTKRDIGWRTLGPIYASTKTVEASAVARQARFEHGETPKALGSIADLKKFMESLK